MTDLIFPPDLVDDLASRRAVFFVGAGASAAAVGRRKDVDLLDWERFLTKMSELLADPQERKFVSQAIVNREFPLAAEVLKDVLQERWIEQLELCYNPPNIQPSDLHTAIIQSPARLIITTNFDELFERSAVLAKNSEIESTILLDDTNLMKKLRSGGRHIVKIHGTIARPETMIFTWSEYNEKALYNDRYARFLESIFLNYTVIFVGTSMRDPMINYVLDSISSRFGKLRPHYIFDLTSHRSPDDRFRFEKRGLRLLSYNVDGTGYASLPRHIDRLTREANQKVRERLSAQLAIAESEGPESPRA